jgi:hypothetical protein
MEWKNLCGDMHSMGYEHVHIFSLRVLGSLLVHIESPSDPTEISSLAPIDRTERHLPIESLNVFGLKTRNDVYFAFPFVKHLERLRLPRCFGEYVVKRDKTSVSTS